MKKTEDLATLEELAKMKRKISPDREITLPVSLANVDSRLDLFFTPEKRSGWINIYDRTENAHASRRIYDTEEEALKCASKERVYTIKIEWEE